MLRQVSHFNIAGLEEQLAELRETMNEPDFWSDLTRSTEVSKKVRIAENKINHWKKLQTRADDVDATMELAEEMEDEDLVTEAGNEIKSLQEDLEALRLETLLRGDYDSNNAYLSPMKTMLTSFCETNRGEQHQIYFLYGLRSSWGTPGENKNNTKYLIL